jgi:hypothetical protein
MPSRLSNLVNEMENYCSNKSTDGDVSVKEENGSVNANGVAPTGNSRIKLKRKKIELDKIEEK